MKRKKKLSIFIVILIGILVIPIFSHAQNLVRLSSETGQETEKKGIFSDFWGKGWDFINLGKEGDSQFSTEGFTREIIPLIQLLVMVSLIILSIAILIIGIKYMVANAKQKAELKKKLTGVIIAATIILSSYTIWRIVYNFLNEVANGLK